MRRVQSSLLALAFTICSVWAASQQPATIIVDAGRRAGAVNRLIFGHNMEAADNSGIFASDTINMDGIQTGGGFWSPATGAPVPEVINACKDVGMGMMRYPGGCLAHNFDWRKAVGPEAKKNGWVFGVDQYLALCKAIGAEPIFTMSDYVLPSEEMPEYAASLVEYLNAVADPSHPWAVKRKDWGHPEPYHVTWFELGNESVHGNHRVLPHRQFTPEAYAAYANATAEAMRKVDPAIRIGIVMVPSAGTDVDNNWNRTVVHLAGRSADFIVVHLYAPHLGKDVANDANLMQATIAVGEQSEHHLEEYLAMARRESGRDLPLAVTEYNGSLGETERPYRFSYGEALESADMVRVFLKPEHHVLTANYWQFLNGYFGMLRGSARALHGEPAFPLYELWGQHFGTELVSTTVVGPRTNFEGAGSVQPASGREFHDRTELQRMPIEIVAVKSQHVTIDAQPTGFTLRWNDVEGNVYPIVAQLTAPQSPEGAPLDYDISFEARFISEDEKDLPTIGVGLGDARGWEVTHSGIGIDGIGKEWHALRGTYSALQLTRQLNLTARLQSAKQPIFGRLEVRKLEVQAFTAAMYPAYNLLTSTSSLSANGQTLYLIIFNKSETETIATQIDLKNFIPQRARLWQVNGASLGSFDGVSEAVSGETLRVSAGAMPISFPPHSMSAIEFAR